MRLVTVAHGTRHATGNRVAAEITAQAGARLRIQAETAYVELCEPLLDDVLAVSSEPAVVVPLLLSTGYHVRHDLPRSAASAPGAVTVGPPLGPDPALAAVQVERLRAAGAPPGGPVVLVAAGSQDPEATADLERAAELLAAAWGAPARLATLAGLGQRPDEVVHPGDLVSPYLLSPGFFADRARRLTRAAGAAVVAEPLGAHPLVVDLVVTRAEQLLGGLPGGAGH